MIDYRKIVESGPFTIIKWNYSVGWPIEYITENVQKITGYLASEFISEKINYFNLLADDDLKNIDQQITAAHQELRDHFKLENYCIKHRNGKTVWIEQYVTVLRSVNGSVTGYVGYLMDVSLRVTTEKELSESQNETRALVNALPDTILELSTSGELKQYLRNKNEKNSDVYVNDIFPSHVSKEIPAYLQEAISSKSIIIHEYEKTLLDNTIRYYEARFSEKNDSDALIIIRDITQRKEYEQTLKKAMQDVEHANNEKTRFLSNMSHELRTPLNAIMGFSQILIEAGGESVEPAKEILQAGEHLLTLINDILDIAKVEAGKIDVYIEPLSISDILEECKTLILPLAKKSNIRFSIAGDIPEIIILADKTRMTQVLLNLLSNAIKYNCTDGNVTLMLDLMDIDTLKISIVDTGIGLTVEQLEKLFQPFERVGAEKSGVEGTGLGLALTKNLIELMGGQIGVESIPDKGTTFWFTIKIADGPVQPVHDQIEQKSEVKEDVLETLSGKKLTILCIEDNPANQRLIQTVIANRTPHDLHVVSLGQAGISMANELVPDIILLDINLPDLSGYDVLAELKKSNRTRDIPVIAISANATPDDLEKASKTEFYMYLPKPIDTKKLVEIINSFR